MSFSYTLCILIFLVAPGTNMQSMLLLCFSRFYFFGCHQYDICMEQESGSFMLFNFLWFCLYCMYFFKGFWGRPQKYRSACERGRTCIFTGYPPPLQLQSGLLCTCITEAPNKTLWLACEKTLCSLCVTAISSPLNIYTCSFSRAPSWLLMLHVSHTRTRLIMKHYSHKHYSTSWHTLGEG